MNWRSVLSWLVGCFRLNGQTVFQSISGRLPTRGRKKKEMIDERKQTNTPPATTGTTVSSCSTICQIVGRPGTGS